MLHWVAIAWPYGVLMMTLAEATSPQGTLLGTVVTFVLYGALPLAIVLYILAVPARKQARPEGRNLPPESRDDQG